MLWCTEAVRSAAHNHGLEMRRPQTNGRAAMRPVLSGCSQRQACIVQATQLQYIYALVGALCAAAVAAVSKNELSVFVHARPVSKHVSTCTSRLMLLLCMRVPIIGVCPGLVIYAKQPAENVAQPEHELYELSMRGI